VARVVADVAVAWRGCGVVSFRPEVLRGVVTRMSLVVDGGGSLAQREGGAGGRRPWGLCAVQCFGSARIRRCGGASGESPALTLGRCRQRRRHGVVPLLEGVVVELHYTTLREKSLASDGRSGR
jgi:hypothetical protein